MQFVENNPAARWLPSRHRFALARLIASLVHSHASPKITVDHLLLSIHRDQSAIESYAISIWLLIATSAYVASLIPLPIAGAIAIAIPLSALLLQVPIFLPGTSFLIMLLQFCLAAYFADAESPVHYVAWFSLILFIANAIAWLIDRFLGI